MYRLYIDESGDHYSSHPENIGKRYLGLIGVMFNKDAHHEFTTRLDRLKQEHFPDHSRGIPLIFHREDILNKRGSFCVLKDNEKCRVFDRDLLNLIHETDFKAVAVVIDKVSHATKKYRRLKHPYHYSLLGMLERYCGWLSYAGKKGDVMAESRGTKEDRALKEAYRSIYTHGAYYLQKSKAQGTLTSCEIKLQKKESDIAGLQMADILAHPLTRDVLLAYGRIGSRGSEFADKISEVAKSKYNINLFRGQIKGYGQVILA